MQNGAKEQSLGHGASAKGVVSRHPKLTSIQGQVSSIICCPIFLAYPTTDESSEVLKVLLVGGDRRWRSG
jgi:hypothetical protein